MSEKSKKTCPGKDTFERMNFLYQAASHILPTSKVLSCYYGAQCKSISRKALQRMEPEMKRTVCKQCGMILVPGESADLSIENDNETANLCTIKCDKCGATKRFGVNSKYNLWLDLPESINEVIKPNEIFQEK